MLHTTFSEILRLQSTACSCKLKTNSLKVHYTWQHHKYVSPPDGSWTGGAVSMFSINLLWGRSLQILWIQPLVTSRRVGWMGCHSLPMVKLTICWTADLMELLLGFLSIWSCLTSDTFRLYGGGGREVHSSQLCFWGKHLQTLFMLRSLWKRDGDEEKQGVMC